MPYVKISIVKCFDAVCCAQEGHPACRNWVMEC